MKKHGQVTEPMSHAYRCTRHGTYRQHSHHCPGCIDDIYTILRALYENERVPELCRKIAAAGIGLLGRSIEFAFNRGDHALDHALHALRDAWEAREAIVQWADDLEAARSEPPHVLGRKAVLSDLYNRLPGLVECYRQARENRVAAVLNLPPFQKPAGPGPAPTVENKGPEVPPAADAE